MVAFRGFSPNGLAPGRVYGITPGEQCCWGQCARGWRTGRCTIGVRLLTRRFSLRVGLCRTRIAGLGDLAETDALVQSQCEALVCLNDQSWLVGQGPPGDHRNLRVFCRRESVLDRDDDLAWGLGSTLWLQLDADTGAVRLRVDDADLGVVGTLPSPLEGPVFPSFVASLEGEGDGDDAIELL